MEIKRDCLVLPYTVIAAYEKPDFTSCPCFLSQVAVNINPSKVPKVKFDNSCSRQAVNIKSKQRTRLGFCSHHTVNHRYYQGTPDKISNYAYFARRHCGVMPIITYALIMSGDTRLKYRYSRDATSLTR